MNPIEKRIEELGKFVRFGEAVTIDVTKKILRVLPFSQPEKMVEIPNADIPSDESLDLRTKSF